MAIPKGSLERETFSFLRQAGLDLYGEDRSYRPVTSFKGLSLKILRPQEIPILVQEGKLDRSYTFTGDVSIDNVDFSETLHRFPDWQHYRWKVIKISVKPTNIIKTEEGGS